MKPHYSLAEGEVKEMLKSFIPAKRLLSARLLGAASEIQIGCRMLNS
ncbi:hypothetical protein F3157_13695 [Virgibacillus dakarensis]|nr:hypothetical protein [Virgibacillus dakarensis]